MKTRLTLLSLGLLWAGLLSTRAALTWEKTDVALHPSISDKTAVAHFKYKNTGDKPVKITSVHASCGCTTAALAKDVVEPNESGEIVATFNIGGRTGVQSKTITVMTDDQPDHPTVLKLTANIPRLLEIKPTFLSWSANDVLNPKTITVDVAKDYPVTKLDVTSSDKSIATEVKPVPEKKEFQIVVKPTESGRPINAALVIKADYPKDQPTPFYAHLRIDSRATMPK